MYKYASEVIAARALRKIAAVSAELEKSMREDAERRGLKFQPISPSEPGEARVLRLPGINGGRPTPVFLPDSVRAQIEKSTGKSFGPRSAVNKRQLADLLDQQAAPLRRQLRGGLPLAKWNAMSEDEKLDYRINSAKHLLGDYDPATKEAAERISGRKFKESPASAKSKGGSKLARFFLGDAADPEFRKLPLSEQRKVVRKSMFDQLKDMATNPNMVGGACHSMGML